MKALKLSTDKQLYYLGSIIKSEKNNGQISRAGKIKDSKISLVVDKNGIPEALRLDAAG